MVLSCLKLQSILTGRVQDVVFLFSVRWWRSTVTGEITGARSPPHPRAHQVRDGEKERHTAVEFFTGRREGPAGTSHYLKVILFHTTKTRWHVKVCPNRSAGPRLILKRSKPQSGNRKRIIWWLYSCVDHLFAFNESKKNLKAKNIAFLEM